MSDLNEVRLLGRLGAAPELRELSSGSKVCKLRVATGKKWKDKETGELKEQTQWHSVSVWGKQAEHCAKFLSKGRQVLVCGELRYSTQGEGDDKKFFTEINAEQVVFVGGGGGGEKQEKEAAKVEDDVAF